MLKWEWWNTRKDVYYDLNKYIYIYTYINAKKIEWAVEIKISKFMKEMPIPIGMGMRMGQIDEPNDTIIL